MPNAWYCFHLLGYFRILGPNTIAYRSVEKYVLGSGKRLEIEVEVQNEGEDAFESSFELSVPSGLNYVKIERKDDFERDIPVQCSPPSFNNNNTLHCDIGNPLPRDKLVRFLVLLQPYYQKTMNSTYNFTMSVNSTNPEKNRTVSDNLVQFVIPIWVVTELSISGSSRPVDVYYNSSQYVMDETQITKESQIGPQVAHLYTITNKGPSEFYQAKATILWPSYTLKGEPLLYLLEEPETSGDISCHVEDEEYNVKRLKLERRGKSFFEDLTDGEMGESSAWTSSAHQSETSAGGGSYSKTSSSSWSSSSRSSGSGSSSSGSAAKAHLSREERLRFEEEERHREADEAAKLAGDGSDRHIERAKARVQGNNHYSRNGGKLESDSYSSGYEGNTRDRVRTDSRGSGSSGRRVDESYSSSQQSGGTGGVTKTKSSERTSHTTWGRGGGRTETAWREEEDGVVQNGSNVVEHGLGNRNRDSTRIGIPGGEVVERTYERESSRSSSSRNRGGSIWTAEDDATRRRAEDGAVFTDDGSLEASKRRGQGGAGGMRTSEEKRTEWNTTWSSGGRPVTSEHTSWRKQQNGAVVGSGDHTRTYEGSVDASRSGTRRGHDDRSSTVEGGAVVVDDGSLGASRRRGQGGAGGTRTSEEKRTEWNTTWSSGGRPVTSEHTSWRKEQNGAVVGSGDHTRTYDGSVDASRSGTRRGHDDRSSTVEGSAVLVDDGSLGASRRRGQGGATGTRTSEQKRTEWNTTWSSGGRPVTSEHTSWRKEQNGAVVGSGDHTRTYEGSVDASRSGTRRGHDDRSSTVESGAVVVDDGSSGASRRRGQGAAAGTRTSEDSRGVSWRVEGDGMTRHSSGDVVTDGGTLEVSRRRGHGGTAGTRVSEEHNTEWNTTWASGGRPVTAEHTSWKKEKDGVTVGSGEHSRTYEGTAERAKTELESRLKEQLDRRIAVASQGSGDSELDHNLISGGGDTKTYKKEWEEHYNTTWGTSTGGKPVTVAKTTWTIEEDGKVKTGSGSRTYEGVAPGTDGTIAIPTHSGGRHRAESSSQGGQGGGIHSEARHHSHHESRTSSSGSVAGTDDDDVTQDQVSGSRRSESRRTESSSRTSSSHQSGSGHRHHLSNENEGDDREETDRTLYYGAAGAATGSSSHSSGRSSASERRTYEEEETRRRLEVEAERRAQAEAERRGHHGAESTYSETHSESGRRTHGHRSGESNAERRTHAAGSTGIAGAVGESAGSSTLDIGAIARGPGDGKARTYVADLGILDAERSSSGSRSSSHHSATDGDRRHSTAARERHYSFGGEGAARDEGSDSYSGVRGSSSGSGYRSEARYASGRTYSTGTRNIEGDPDLDPDYESRKTGGGGSSSSHSWSRSYSSRDGSVPEEPVISSEAHRAISNQESSGFRHYRRERRYADDSYDNYRYDDYDEDDSVKKCTGPVKCTRIVCTIGALKKDQEVHVAVRSRLWLPTVKKIAPHVETVLGSQITAKVTLLPTIGRPSTETMTKNSTEIKTRIMPEPVAQPDVVPLWIVVLSAVCGALILMLLVYILYKLGFFKRNRPEPSTGSEKTPLNRNGHYQGDEPL